MDELTNYSSSLYIFKIEFIFFFNLDKLLILILIYSIFCNTSDSWQKLYLKNKTSCICKFFCMNDSKVKLLFTVYRSLINYNTTCRLKLDMDGIVQSVLGLGNKNKHDVVCDEDNDSGIILCPCISAMKFYHRVLYQILGLWI